MTRVPLPSNGIHLPRNLFFVSRVPPTPTEAQTNGNIFTTPQPLPKGTCVRPVLSPSSLRPSYHWGVPSIPVQSSPAQTRFLALLCSAAHSAPLAVAKACVICSPPVHNQILKISLPPSPSPPYHLVAVSVAVSPSWPSQAVADRHALPASAWPSCIRSSGSQRMVGAAQTLGTLCLSFCHAASQVLQSTVVGRICC